MNKKNIKQVIFGILAVLALVVLANSMVVTYENEYKLVKRFGKIARVVDAPGLTFKIPFVETTSTLPCNIQLYDLAKSDVITSEKKTMVADTYAVWRITDPLKFSQKLNSIPNAQNRINTVIYNALKTVIGNMTQAEVISARDGELSEKITATIGSTMEQYGIALVSVETKRVDLPDDNKAAVYERMISEREQIAASYTAEGNSESQIIKNATDKEVQVKLAEARAEAEKTIAAGEAAYMQILAQAYNTEEKSEFYAFVRALDAAKTALQGEDKTLILSKDSPLAQLFY